MMKLVVPATEHLESYAAALKTGWSPDNLRAARAQEELAEIEADPAAFVASMDMRNPGDSLITLPDGSKVPRLPGYRRWMWDGDFCGSIGFRWVIGTSALPSYVLGHVGYSVVPWKQKRGYATEALRLILPEAAAEGLDYIEITTTPENIPSQKVITANGGVLIETFIKEAAYGGAEALRYRIATR